MGQEFARDPLGRPGFPPRRNGGEPATPRARGWRRIAHIAATVRPARTSWAPLAVMADAGGYRDRPVAPIGRRAAGRGLQDPATLMPMTGDGPQIVIKGRREDWPGGAWTLTPREPGREPNRQTFWFGGRARRDAVARGERLVDALLAWLTPARRLGPEVNRFQVLVSDDGDTRGSSATAATEARPRPVAAGRLRLNGGTMKLIPHHQDDKHGTREYRSPDGAWRVVQTRRPGGSRNARPRWEAHERCEGRGAGWRHHAAFERRRDALPGHPGRSVGGRERHDSARQAARDPRTLAGTTPVQPAPDAEGADHARPRRNPLPGHPVVVVRRAPVRSEADREGGRAGDLREVPAVPVGGQLPETPGSDEGGEEGDLTGRRVGPAADRKRGRTPAPPAPAPRNGSSVVMTTETEFNISEEPLAERVLRQVRSGQLDESRLLPSAEKRARDVVKKLNRLAARQGWHTFMAGQAYAVATGKAPSKRNAEVMAVEQVMRWRSEVSRFAPDRLAEFDELIADALNNPAPVQKADQ